MAGLTAAQRTNTDTDLGIKFESDAEREKATTAVQTFLKSKGADLVYTGPDGRKHEIDGIDGAKTHAAISKYADKAELRAVAEKALGKAPVPPPVQKPVTPAEPTASEPLPFVRARNYVYYGGPQDDPAIKTGSNVDPTEVAIDVKPGKAIAQTAVRFERAYVATRNALLKRIDTLIKLAETEKDPAKIGQYGTEMSILADAVRAMDKDALALKSAPGRADGKSGGADIDSQNFVLRLQRAGRLVGLAVDEALVAQVGGTTANLIGKMPSKTDVTDAKQPKAACAFGATDAQPLLATTTWPDADKIHVMPNSGYPAGRDLVGYYQVLRTIYQGTSCTSAIPELSPSQFMRLLELNPELEKGLGAFREGKAFDLPRTFTSVAFWRTGASASAA